MDISKLYPNHKLYGPYVRKSDSRRYYVLVELENGKTSRKSKKKSILSSRLQIELSIGKRLPTDLEVNHKDGNRCNDDIENLEVLDSNFHKSQDAIRQNSKRKTRKEIYCPHCNAKFVCSAFRIKVAKSKGKKPCCSRVCSSLRYGANQYG
jgi:hypothetical protein